MNNFLKYFWVFLFASLGLQAQAETRWKVIEDDSNLSFTVSIGGSQTQGQFDAWSADILFDPDAPAQAFVAVDVEIGSASTDAPQATSLIGTEEWLGSRAYPNARFVGRGFDIANDQVTTIAGMLSLKGIDVPIELVGLLIVEGDTARANFETTLWRSIFGIGDENPAVADTVTVTATLNAIRIAE